MELKDFIAETIYQIATGVMNASEKCQDINVIVNPNITVGRSGDYWIPKDISGYKMERRVQMINMDICVTVSESENKMIEGKASIKVLGIGANTTGISSRENENRVKFSIPVCLPTTEIETNK